MNREKSNKKMRFIKISSLLLALSFVLVVATACGTSEEADSENEDNAEESVDNNENNQGDNQNSDDNEFNLLESGTLTYATEGAFKPFNYMDGDEMIGFEIDLADAIAEKLGLETNPVKARFDGIVLGVQNNRYDVGIASLTITDERKEFVNFSNPYYATKTRIYTRPDSDINTADDLTDKEIAVSRGSTFKDIALEYTDDSNIKEYDGDVVVLQALAEGHHDAAITNNMIGQKSIEEGLEIVEKEDDLMVNKAGVAVSKENDELLEAINQALKELDEEGVLEEISMEWIGVDISEPQN